jgi:flagellar biosynthesis protein FlhB
VTETVRIVAGVVGVLVASFGGLMWTVAAEVMHTDPERTVADWYLATMVACIAVGTLLMLPVAVVDFIPWFWRGTT